MKKRVHFLCVIVIFLSCSNVKENRDRHISTYPIPCFNKSIYLESFKIWNGGVIGGELKSDYLTDSLNFRYFIGTMDEHENYLYKCSKDTLYIFKIETGSKNCHWVTQKDGSKSFECEIDTIEQRKITLPQLLSKGFFK